MAFGLKTVRYKDAERRILLQNENGPCPLLAAANCLLLKGAINLPAHCIRNSVASLEDVVNMLANEAMANTSKQEGGHLLLDELLQILPKFQYGMDVNPKFTDGITGYEYTRELSVLDMLDVKLVHGWLMDPVHDEAVMLAVGSKAYNELVECIIHGKEAESQLSDIHKTIDDVKAKQRDLGSFDLLDDVATPDGSKEESSQIQLELERLQEKYDSISQQAKDATLIDHFVHSTGHQLTHFGLVTLHETLQENELCIFFRNNHFGTMTKHEGSLFLLVTDLGYSHSPEIIWEKLDMIDGDTELVNSQFLRCGAQSELLASGPSLSPEQLLAQSGQKDADYHLALSLSMEQQGKAPDLDKQEGQLMAAATEASLRDYHGLENPSGAAAATAASAATKEYVEVGVPVNPPPSSATVACSATAPSTTGSSSQRDGHSSSTQEDADRILAMQLEARENRNEDASLALAQQLQHEENQRAAAAQRGRTTTPQRTPQRQQPASRSPSSSASSNKCIIS